MVDPGAQGTGQPGGAAGGIGLADVVDGARGFKAAELGGVDFSNLDKIKPDSWNNIALPLTEAVKIIIEELKDFKKQTGLCSSNITDVGKRVNKAANVAVTECKKLAVELADQKEALTTRIDQQILANNKLLDVELRKPLKVEIEMTDQTMDRKFAAADKRNKEFKKQVDEMIACAVSECRAYADALDKEMLQNFEVPGHVNKTDFITDEEAAAAGQFFHLGSWLKSNEEILRALVDELDEKVYKLVKQDELILSAVATNEENAKKVKKLLQKADKEIK